jgi:hypothetical protein
LTVDELTIEDEITAVRLDWLAAEAALAELLPSTTVTSTAEPTGRPATDEIAGAIERAQRTHQAYMETVGRWAGLSAT